MACKEETKVIDNLEIYCRQWPAQESIEMKFRLIEVFGPAIGGIGEIMGESDSTEEVDAASAVSKIIDSVFARSNPKQITRLIMDVVNSANIDGTRMNDAQFDQIFSGDIMTSYKVFFFVLKVNYQDFFKGKLAKGLLAKFKARENELTSATSKE